MHTYTQTHTYMHMHTHHMHIHAHVSPVEVIHDDDAHGQAVSEHNKAHTYIHTFMHTYTHNTHISAYTSHAHARSRISSRSNTRGWSGRQL